MSSSEHLPTIVISPSIEIIRNLIFQLLRIAYIKKDIYKKKVG